MRRETTQDRDDGAGRAPAMKVRALPRSQRPHCKSCGRKVSPRGEGYLRKRQCGYCFNRPVPTSPWKCRYCLVCDTQLFRWELGKCGKCAAEFGIDRPASWDQQGGQTCSH